MRLHKDDYTQEFFFNGRWYDANDPEQMEILDAEIDRQNERDEDEADWRYHSRRDEMGPQ